MMKGAKPEKTSLRTYTLQIHSITYDTHYVGGSPNGLNVVVVSNHKVCQRRSVSGGMPQFVSAGEPALSRSRELPCPRHQVASIASVMMIWFSLTPLLAVDAHGFTLDKQSETSCALRSKARTSLESSIAVPAYKPCFRFARLE